MSKIMPLKRCELFHDFSFGELSMLAPHLLEESHAEGHRLLKKGDGSHGLVVIASGKVAMNHEIDSLSFELETGGYFGEYSLLDGQTFSEFTVQATHPIELLRMTPHQFVDLKAKNTAIALKLLEGVLKVTRQKVLSIRELLLDQP